MDSLTPSPKDLVFVRRMWGRGLARVTARRGAATALHRRVADAFSLDLPDGPRRVVFGPAAFLGVGPAAWLALKNDGGEAWAEHLAEQLHGFASVCDQSSGYALFHLAGPKAAEVLAKGVPVDLDPEAFTLETVAVTRLAHMDAVLWREDEGFTLAVFRSLAGSFLDWLNASAGEFGLVASTQDDLMSQGSADV